MTSRTLGLKHLLPTNRYAFVNVTTFDDNSVETEIFEPIDKSPPRGGGNSAREALTDLATHLEQCAAAIRTIALKEK